MACKICGKKTCFLRNHESRCDCGIYNTFRNVTTEYAYYKCNNCGKISKIVLISKETRDLL